MPLLGDSQAFGEPAAASPPVSNTIGPGFGLGAVALRVATASRMLWLSGHCDSRGP